VTKFRVRSTETQANRLKDRMREVGLHVQYQEEPEDRALVLIFHNLSEAHALREIVVSEGIPVLYDDDD
jgi:hypothetical protein